MNGGGANSIAVGNLAGGSSIALARTEPQCEARSDGYRCDLNAGHPGQHYGWRLEKLELSWV